MQHFIRDINVMHPLDEICRDRLTKIAEPIQTHPIGAIFRARATATRYRASCCRDGPAASAALRTGGAGLRQGRCPEDVRLLDPVVRLGRQDAGERVVRLLLELHDRMAR
ncbi:hypothetical protein P7B02_02380 [Caulobacter segnis]|uniref:hypothetical protein n=1 Tax=Caulobacter segnis TaxID=88688 RepID=UPI0024100CBE|nr:hypothetical protein [Caulobacter segnis]MDG2520374.1 hypothetical protein [Caulobacter segnis]